MPKKKTSKQNPPEQPTVSDIVPSRFKYDVDLVEDFLDMVFHADPPEDGNILTWFASTGSPKYPMSEEDLSKRLHRAGTGVALYFGTSTTARDPIEDRLFNRKALFRSFHVLVLDDIGTKVPFSKIPDTFDPTYKIETSQGNWQYGYVLEKPLTDEVQAVSLVQLAYDAGLSDAGGKMATKLVRLPGGINGKPGPTGDFKVRLEDMDGPFWTPEDILAEIDVGVVWSDVVKDAEAVMRTRAVKNVGTSAWSPIAANMPTLSGIIDPALEWLYGQKMVKQETNEWVTIKCPWADTHSAGGDDVAGYSPMGWGGPAYINQRTFHCFHEHCKGQHSAEFLDYVANNTGPELPSREHAMDLVKRYVYYGQKDGVFDVTKTTTRFLPIAGFKNKHPELVYVHQLGAKKTKAIAETRMFITSKARVSVDGMVYDPTTPQRIVPGENGDNLLNTFARQHPAKV